MDMELIIDEISKIDNEMYFLYYKLYQTFDSIKHKEYSDKLIELMKRREELVKKYEESLQLIEQRIF